jgi:hypothetical protein
MAYSDIFAKMKELLSRGYDFLDRERLYPLYVFLFFFSFFSVTYLTLDRVFALDDHFFHIRFAESLHENGMATFTEFQSIYFSRMGIGQEYFVYYNFLFYLALMPFALITPLVLGIKLYGTTVLAISFTTVYFFLRSVAVRYPFLWAIGFLMVLIQSGWLFRFTLARPFTLAPVFLVVMLYFIHKKKYLISALIAFLYFYWHTATFMFPFCLALGYFLFEQFYGKRPDWKMILFPLFGTMAAVFSAYLISPGIVAYLRDVIFPVFFDTTMTKSTGIAEGGEVYGRGFFSTFSAFFWLVAILTIAGAYEVIRYMRGKKGLLRSEDAIDLSIQPLRALLFMSSIAFLALTMLSGRFLDYFVYFCVLYIAISATDFVRFFEIKGSVFRSAFRAGSLIVAAFLFVNLPLNFYESLSNSRTHLVAQAPAEWLSTNLERDKIIFNVDWDSFPTLYYFTSDKFRYTTGLEPRFLYDLDARKYWIWKNIGDGIYCEMSDCEGTLESRKIAIAGKKSEADWYERQGALIAGSILREFETDIVVVSIWRKDLLSVMDNSDAFRKEFSDDQSSTYSVYRVLLDGK